MRYPVPNILHPLTMVIGCALSAAVIAAPPTFQNRTCPVRLDGVRLGADLTPDGSSLRNTIAYEPATHLYHLWVMASEDSNFPATSALHYFTHATSTDGLHFASDGQLNYEIGSANWADYGSAIDPPLDFLRAVFSADSGTWKLFAWTESVTNNAGPNVGQYNYNTSVNDLGGVASNTYALHQGPLQSPVAGNHVGTFGLVDGKLYLRVDSEPGTFGGSGGGAGEFAYSDMIPPATSAELGEADLFIGTPYCWFLHNASCGTTDERLPAYVHNVGRTLRQSDGTLVSYYTFRDAVSYARVDQQVWFVASTDNGATWSAPAGVFADASALTIDGAPLAANGNFGTVESVQQPNICRMYFSTKDANGQSVMVSATTGSACDALFADGFEGCGD